MWRTWQIVLAVTVLALAAAAVGGLMLQRRVDARLNEAASRVAAAERQAALAGELADKRIAATRDDAEHRIQEARQTAESAQVISGVLAAPDLITSISWVSRVRRARSRRLCGVALEASCSAARDCRRCRRAPRTRCGCSRTPSR
jgi:uncharacterized membrane protein YdcZ (DUF606 family)